MRIYIDVLIDIQLDTFFEGIINHFRYYSIIIE